MLQHGGWAIGEVTTVHRKAAMARFEGVNEKHEHTLTYYNEEDEKAELSNLTVEGRATRVVVAPAPVGSGLAVGPAPALSTAVQQSPSA